MLWQDRLYDSRPQLSTSKNVFIWHILSAGLASQQEKQEWWGSWNHRVKLLTPTGFWTYDAACYDINRLLSYSCLFVQCWVSQGNSLSHFFQLHTDSDDDGIDEEAFYHSSKAVSSTDFKLILRTHSVIVIACNIQGRLFGKCDDANQMQNCILKHTVVIMITGKYKPLDHILKVQISVLQITTRDFWSPLFPSKSISWPAQSTQEKDTSPTAPTATMHDVLQFL